MALGQFINYRTALRSEDPERILYLAVPLAVDMYNGEFSTNINDFTELIHRVLSREEVILSQAGTPVALISPYSDRKLWRIPGLDKGKVIIADDFNEPLPEEIINDFLGFSSSEI